MSPHDSAVARPPGALSGEVFVGGRSIPYLLVRTAQRRRTISLDLLSDGAVRVRAPQRAARDEIEAFVRQRARWIEKAQAELRSRPVPRFITGESFPLLGKKHRFWVQLADRDDIDFSMRRGRLQAAVPFRLDDSRRASVISDGLKSWYVDAAEARLQQVVRRWTGLTGLKPARVLVRDQKRRWGSCSADDSIRLNWRLVMLDPALIDYVVVHELAHLRVPNHSPRFWAEVERWIPESRRLRRQLTQASKTLPF
ncbi:MAG TPA: SprT family zinc-dependent metalloprotease [Dehalococcoidia bacterium]|nr:SprT family zinc-dependent metalloprotease [Dehalococcoidia bacterium]